VAFVSLTGESRDAVQLFAEQFSVPWPCGYAAAPISLARFGVHTGKGPYGVWPTLFLIGADGRVVWNDGSARPTHRLSPEAVVQDLDERIEHTLDELADAE
jgi:hypothetical protein